MIEKWSLPLPNPLYLQQSPSNVSPCDSPPAPAPDPLPFQRWDTLGVCWPLRYVFAEIIKILVMNINPRVLCFSGIYVGWMGYTTR